MLLTATDTEIRTAVDGWLTAGRPEFDGCTLADAMQHYAADSWGCDYPALVAETVALALGIPSDEYDLDPTGYRLVADSDSDSVEWLESDYDSGWLAVEFERLDSDDDPLGIEFVPYAGDALAEAVARNLIYLRGRVLPTAVVA